MFLHHPSFPRKRESSNTIKISTTSDFSKNSHSDFSKNSHKEDFIWVNDLDNPIELGKALDIWIHNYNMDYPHLVRLVKFHKSFRYMTLCQFNKQFNT